MRKISNIIQKRSFLLGWILLRLLMACNPSDDEGTNNPDIEDPLEPQPVVTTSVSGVVIDEAGTPIANAEISIFGETTATDDHGGFSLPEIEVPGNRCVVQAKMDGYFIATRAHKPIKNGHTEVRLVMMAQPVTHSFDAGSGVEAIIENGSQVTIQPNSLVTESGDSYDGPVTMSMRYLDPSAGNFGVLVSGGDMLARREDESTSILYSYGILRVVMTGSNGENLQLAAGKTSSLTMDIPDDQLNTAPATVPLWYFDEDAGIWVEDGSATRDGDKYVGTVSHFTDWNCDSDTDGATIIGRLIDCDGNPGWGQVEFGQITSDPQSYAETNQSDGRFSRRVPDGVSITVVISDPLIISPLSKDERGKVIVIVPPLAPGQVYDVGDIQTFPCHVKVKGTFKTSEGDRVNSIYFSTETGIKSVVDPGSELNTTLPADADIMMTIYTEDGLFLQSEIRTPSEGNELDLGLIDITGTVTIDQEVTITGRTLCFGEPETGGQISVSWQDESGTNFNYTSANADGTFQIAAPLNQTVLLSSSTSNGNWQNTVITGETAGAIIDIGTLEICENDLLGTTSMIINGDGYDNELITLVQNVNIPALNAGLFYPATDMTLVFETDISEERSLTVQFPGKHLGGREYVGEISLSVRIIRDGVETLYWTYPEIPGTSLQLTITKYDEVGGVIEGTFSGTFYGYRNSVQIEETVTIKDGKFSVLRYADVE
jgi:hypothetical protein